MSITTEVSCDENGHSTNGDHLDGDEDPASVSVFVGESPDFSGKSDAVGHAIVAPKTNQLCDSDIALIVLDRPIPWIQPTAVNRSSSRVRGSRLSRNP